jgi:hypothetical protein
MGSENKESYITVYESVSGWKAIQIWWNEPDGGFWEPWQTGMGAYATPEGAEEEARGWAEAEGLRYIPRGAKPS